MIRTTGHASRVTAIVVTHNSAHVLPQCLAALKREGAAMIVVDNASSDRSTEIAAAHGARILRSGANGGYGRANNLGVDCAATEFVLICNPDVTLEPGSLAGLLAAAQAHPMCGMVAPRIVSPDGRDSLRETTFLSPGTRIARDDTQPVQSVVMLPGSCLLMRRDLFMRVGGFDPNIFLFYEDDDLCRRLRDLGHDLLHVKAACVTHRLGGSTMPTRGHVFRVRYHQAWSKAYVAAKYGLASPVPGTLLTFGLKYLSALLTLRFRKAERYAGSFAGAFAFLQQAPARISPKRPFVATEAA